MAKTKISEYSATSADNTDISNINIAEGCSPANVNNAIRTVMAQLKDQQAGTSGDPFTVSGTLTASGTLTSSGTLAITGGLTLDGAAGTSGQALVSAGSSNTPTWTTLGTIASQNANAVSITGGTITGITDLTVADGGTGASTLSANAVLLGNGTSALQTVAPSTSGNVLTSNGTTWTSATPAGGIGIGQTWQDVTGSRAAGTTYTNSTGKPIFISVFGTGSPNSGVMSMTVDGVSLGQQGSAAVSSGVFYSTMTAIVPNNSTYRVNNVNGWTLGSWAELR
jgi:hypothetical protein